MRIVGHGVDIVEIARIERMHAEHGAQFLARVYTPEEQRYCLQGRVAATRLAGRFAAKEAVMKVLGTGWGGGVIWTHIETLPDGAGRPVVRLGGAAAAHAARLGIAQVLLSISHSGTSAVASAIGVSE